MIYLYSCACITFQLDNSTVICDKTELRFFHRGNFCSAGIAPLSATPWLLNLGQCKLIARRGKQVAERCMPSSNSQRGVYSGIEEKQLAKTQSQNPLEENDVIRISFRKGNVTSPFVSENFEAFIRLCPSHLSMNSNRKTLTLKAASLIFILGYCWKSPKSPGVFGWKSLSERYNMTTDLFDLNLPSMLQLHQAPPYQRCKRLWPAQRPAMP